MKIKNKEYLEFIKKYVLCTILLIIAILFCYFSMQKSTYPPEPFDLEPLGNLIKKVEIFYCLYLIIIFYLSIKTIKKNNPKNIKIKYLIYTIILYILAIIFTKLLSFIIFHFILFPLIIYYLLTK